MGTFYVIREQFTDKIGASVNPSAELTKALFCLYYYIDDPSCHQRKHHDKQFFLQRNELTILTDLRFLSVLNNICLSI